MHATKLNMVVSRQRLTGIALLLLLLTGAVWLWSGNAPPASAAERQDAKVAALLRERLAALREIADQAAKLYARGSASVAEVHDANEAVLLAELGLADSPTERIAAREKLVAEAKPHDEHVAHLVKTGASDPLMALKAKVHRLEAKIALEREKQTQPDK